MVKRNRFYIIYGSKVIIWLNVIVSISDMEAKFSKWLKVIVSTLDMEAKLLYG